MVYEGLEKTVVLCKVNVPSIFPSLVTIGVIVSSLFSDPTKVALDARTFVFIFSMLASLLYLIMTSTLSVPSEIIDSLERVASCIMSLNLISVEQLVTTKNVTNR